MEEPDFIKYPEPIFFNPSQTFSWNEEEIPIQGKVYTYGALSLSVEIPVKNADTTDVLAMMASNKLEKKIEDIFDNLYRQLAVEFNEPAQQELITNYNHMYHIFCFSSTGYDNVEEIVKSGKDDITALLTGMYQHKDFSREQRQDVLSHKTRFYQEDCTIVYWNNALVIDDNEQFTEKLFIIELANIQFIKLQVFDSFIDEYLSSYLLESNRTFRRWIPQLLPGVSNRIREINELRVELEKMTDIMDNFEKFFGSWYLAKIYYQASKAFEIPRWRKLLDSRMNTVNELFSLLNEEINRSKMLFLNLLMLLLFVLWFVM